jgi:hypothetical protein
VIDLSNQAMYVVVWNSDQQYRLYTLDLHSCQHNVPDNWMPGGILTVSSNGTHEGIVWALATANGDANSFRGVKGMLMAFNATMSPRNYGVVKALTRPSIQMIASGFLLASILPLSPTVRYS